MCLNILIKNNKPITTRYAWKLMRRAKTGKLYGEFKGLRVERTTDKWLNERDFRPAYRKFIRTRYGEPYPLGWHCYQYKIDAEKTLFNLSENFILVKVRVRGNKTLGEQEGKSVIVVEEIFIDSKQFRE